MITAAEGAQQHLGLLRTRAADSDPHTRERFLAGALVPAALVLRAQRFRAWYRARVQELFRGFDVVLAPTTPCVAPLIGKTDGGVIGECRFSSALTSGSSPSRSPSSASR